MAAEASLEKLYHPSNWSKRYDSKEIVKKHVEFIEKHSEIVREKIPCQLDVAYGPGPKEKYDIYGTDLGENAPLFIHIHGGYYQEPIITRTNNGFIANILHKNGIRTVLVGYELCPERTVFDIMEALKVAIKTIVEKLKSTSIYLCGHSAGAHAIATILSELKRSSAFSQENGDSTIKAVFLLCGIYDLEPLTQMSANDLLKMSANDAKEKLSPMFGRLDYQSTDVYVVAAEFDSPAFVDQSRRFHRKLSDCGLRTHLNVVKDVDHFDLIEKVYFEDFELTDLILKRIKLN